MQKKLKVPFVSGQLVWCPGHASLGIGVVVDVEPGTVRVLFARLQEERLFTTRGQDLAVVRYEIAVGERVTDAEQREQRIAGKPVLQSNGLYAYALEDGSQALESTLTPQVRSIGAKERLATLNLSHPETVRARIQGLQLAQFAERPGVAAVLGSRVAWLPHQIDVATRGLQHEPVRMLLADEVGLGKTVEAALIYSALRQEGRAQRVLVLVPDALCIQWLGEMYRKVHELFVLFDEERLNDVEIDFPGMSPFEAHQRIVVSIDRILNDRTLYDQVIQSKFDVLIVDECHHLRWNADTGGNAAYKLVERMAQQSRHTLLLTATPMALDPTEYHALLRILDPIRFDDPASFEAVGERVAQIRTCAADVTQAVAKKTKVAAATAKVLKALFSDDPEDVALLEAFLDVPAKDIERAQAVEPVLAALRHRHALADYVVRNRRGPVGGLPQRCSHVVPLEPTEEQATLIEVGEEIMLELAATVDDVAEQQRMLGEFLRALWATPRALLDIVRPYSAELASELKPHVEAVLQAPLDTQSLPTGDARLRWLVQHLRTLEPSEKILVFVESAIAVRALKDALEPIIGHVAVFHRELPPRDQDRQVAWFRDATGPQVMLSTEAGGEGRNFQFCHHLVLFDLPWRPATVEQRIGRIDRVGQRHDVHVWVPYFKDGYEAAIVKVMQEGIGILDSTVGGIDHALEHVGARIASFILEGAEAEAWTHLYQEIKTLVESARSRIESSIDPVLDFASFSKDRVESLMRTVPVELEQHIETFVQKYAGHSRLELHVKGKHILAIEGAPGASGREDSDAGYTATFSRTYALDHEEVEFLSFGHPLVEQAFQWARESEDVSAGLALCRGFAADGSVFLWHYMLDLPETALDAPAYFSQQSFSFAVDEHLQSQPHLISLLESNQRSLEKMDVGPLRGNQERWARVVEQNYAHVEKMASASVEREISLALERIERVYQHRFRDLKRAHRRAADGVDAQSLRGQELLQRALSEEQALHDEHQKLMAATRCVRARLVAAVAVRLMRNKQVSV